MKKYFALIFLGVLSIFIVFGSSYAWQGRMAGMGEPYGLTNDDSDFLIHPSLITRGNGFDFYSHFDFRYTDINKWDMDIDFDYIGIVIIPPATLISGNYEESFDSSGDQYDYEAMLGPVFDLGTGRMGIFFAYTGMNRDIDGDADYTGSFGVVISDPSTSADYDLESDIDDFSLRVIYGFPIDLNCLNLGAEAKISYINEKQSDKWENNFGRSFFNRPTTTFRSYWEANTLWFQVPYDSDYWLAEFKASANGRICIDDMMPIDVTLSFGGGPVFTGDNEYKYESELSGAGLADLDADGETDGFTVGGDLWVRVPISETLTLPFMVGGHYNEKVRDGKGRLYGLAYNSNFDYEHKEDSFIIDAGGGADIKFSDSSRGTLGLFYTYLDCNDDLWITMSSEIGIPFDAVYEDSVPEYTEHRVTLKLGWETDLSSTSALRAGLNAFYGFIEKEYVLDLSHPPLPVAYSERDEISMDGNQWGITASIGGSLKLSGVTLEPYINGGYRDLDLDGELESNAYLLPPVIILFADGDIEESREEWFVGAGLSILFGN